MNRLNIFIGWDDRESLAYHVLCHSIIRRASIPVTITPIKKNVLGDVYAREKGPTESTDFSLTRFLTPYLAEYKGLAVFMDCDMLCLADMAELIAYVREEPFKAVYVVKHNYIPKGQSKFLGNTQTAYPRKNWSSLMVFNCQHYTAQRITPGYVDKASGLELHRFGWLKDDEIGELPQEWNHLVGEYNVNPNAKILHYTLGTPCLPGYEDCDQAELWWQEMEHLKHG